jgi:hypothetical protein
MKTILPIVMFLFSFNVVAQLRGKYDNPKLNIPEWLTDTSYISEHETDESEIYIDESVLVYLGEITVMKIKMSKTIHNYEKEFLYLGTFDKEIKIIDLIDVATLESSDWNWQTDFSFGEIEPSFLKFFCVDNSYRPAESAEEQEEFGGMVLSSTDTLCTYFYIDNEGSIFPSSEIDELRNTVRQIIEPELADSFDISNFNEEACILNIRKVFTEINQNSEKYRTKTKKSGKTIDITYYYRKGSLKKISEINSSNNQLVEYYFDKKSLIFIFTYNKSKRTESRYYFNKNKMFCWLKGRDKIKISMSESEFKEKEKELLTRCKILTDK